VSFLVSVITPVYNAAPYVRHAVESALALNEVGELILIEDGSSDGSYDICRSLAREHSRVRLFTHSGRRNKGAGASRNVGIRNASFPCVAFLDADDFYLPNRFETAERILTEQAGIDGVYDAVGVHFWSEEGRSRWNRATGKDEEPPPLTVLRVRCAPDELFQLMAPVGGCGHFHTAGVTVRSSVFHRTGLFSTNLPMAQDTNLWMKMAAVARLMPGNLSEPAAMRGVHAGNRIHDAQAVSRYGMEAVYNFVVWALRRNVPLNTVRLALSCWWRWTSRHCEQYGDNGWRRPENILRLLRLLLYGRGIAQQPEFKQALSALTGYGLLKTRAARWLDRAGSQDSGRSVTETPPLSTAPGAPNGSLRGKKADGAS